MVDSTKIMRFILKLYLYKIHMVQMMFAILGKNGR